MANKEINIAPEFWRDDLDDREVMVTIRCITYNHEGFIRDALEGFVMQKTNFRFEAIVHDDASTDVTAAVIREYAEKYPSIIKPIFETENQYSKKDGSLGRIMTAHTRGKYVALCEGDDYWTDPLKLQKQVDFLESHPDYSLCFHNAKTIMLDGTINEHLYNIYKTGDYTPSEILRKWTIPTASVVYRAGEIDTDPARRNPKYKYGDNVLFLTAAKHGKLYGIDEYMSVYRKHPNSAINSVGPLKWTEIHLAHLTGIHEVFSNILEKDLCKICIADGYIYLIRRRKTKPLAIIKYIFLGLKDAQNIFIKRAFRTWILRKPL